MGNEYWIADLGAREALDIGKRGKFIIQRWSDSGDERLIDADFEVIERGEDDPILAFAREWIRDGTGPFAVLCDQVDQHYELLMQEAFTEYDAFDAVNDRPFEGKTWEPLEVTFYDYTDSPLYKHLGDRSET